MLTFTSSNDMKSEITEKLKARLNLTDTTYDAVIDAIVDSAINEIETIRNYPSDCSDEDIWSDMSRYFNNVLELSLYDFNQSGAEGETSHSENGISRVYKDRNACLKGVRQLSVIV